MKPTPPLRLRRAYTLMELLIVLAVLTTVIGLAVPSLRKFSQRGYLQDAARQLRGQLLSARLQAIESASNKFFFYQPDSGIYMVTGADEAPGLGSSAGELLVGDEVSEAEPRPRDGARPNPPSRCCPRTCVFWRPMNLPCVLPRQNSNPAAARADGPSR
jgi:prepilin-type N-terminal cleavage/methylation domain-containing protein